MDESVTNDDCNSLNEGDATSKQRTIVMISCSNSQKEGLNIAHEHYISPLFVKSWMFANKINADEIFILSTKHGLLSPYTYIEQYDFIKPIIGWEKWADSIVNGLKKHGISANDKIIILASDKYCKYLEQSFQLLFPHRFQHIIKPLKNLTIGARLKELNKLNK